MALHLYKNMIKSTELRTKNNFSLFLPLLTSLLVIKSKILVILALFLSLYAGLFLYLSNFPNESKE